MEFMSRDEHEELLNELLSDGISIDRKTEILQSLRVDNVAVHEYHKETTQTMDKMKSDNESLVISNSKLFRQLGTAGNEQAEQEEEEKEFSETVTISELENSAEVY